MSNHIFLKGHRGNEGRMEGLFLSSFSKQPVAKPSQVPEIPDTQIILECYTS